MTPQAKVSTFDQISRRAFMVGAAGLTFGVALRLDDIAAFAETGNGVVINPWVTIAADGTMADHVASHRDGTGIYDLGAFDPCRGARCRLGEGPHRSGSPDRRHLRQSRLHARDVHGREH